MTESTTLADLAGTTPDADLNKALAEAQGEFPPIPAGETVDTGSYSYSYASLATILAATRPALSSRGLALVQRLEAPNGVPSLRTELRHAGGGCIAASFPLPTVPQNVQQLGSLLTYLRRYAIVAILAVAAEDDDDGAQATTATKGEPDATTGLPEGSPFQPPPVLDDRAADTLSEPQRKKIYALRTKLLKAGAFTEEEWQLVMSAEFGTESVAELTRTQASTLIERLVRKEEELD